MPLSRRFVLWASLAGLVISGISCGGPSRIPKSDAARSALETALTAWLDGKKPTEIVQATPPIQVVDNEWTSGRRLISFEITGEKPSADDKQFTVKLKYEKPPIDEEVTYVVIGIDPLSVYREADFLRTLNMDNNPKSKSVPPKRRR